MDDELSIRASLSGWLQQDGGLMGFPVNRAKLGRKVLAFCDYCQILPADY